MLIKFKRTENGLDLPLPSRGTPDSAGIDLRLAKIVEPDYTAESLAGLMLGGRKVITLHLGFSIQIPKGHYGLLAVRSSWGAKGLEIVEVKSTSGWYMTNGVGIIDLDYRGELMMKVVFEHRGTPFPEVGERIAQIVIQPYEQGYIVEVDEVSTTQRGDGGFGSTNRSTDNEH